jgi:hypothetical protein
VVCLPFPRKRKTLLSVVAARLLVDHRLPHDALRNANGDAGPPSPTPQNTQFALEWPSATVIIPDQ